MNQYKLKLGKVGTKKSLFEESINQRNNSKKIIKKFKIN
jgi:hypothetical protein